MSNLKKYFQTSSGMVHAVDGINMEIKKGSTLGVVGESGCGKSTLGRLLVRLLEPTGGEAYFNDQNIFALNKAETKKFRQKMQMIFQDPYASLNPRMTISQTIAQPMKINKIYDNNKDILLRVEELMETVGLAPRYENSYPHELDGGRRQRIGIARALSLNPEFIVCDEPVSALDVSIQAQILNLMMDLQDKMGLTYMFITHNLSVVKHISDEIAVMYLGQCVEKCESKELFKNPLHPYTQALLNAIPTPVLKGGRDRKIIKGEITSPIDPKPGCRFAPRCPYVQEGCTKGEVEFKEVSKGHFVQCILY
ncbi:MAG: ATP-binding cassette domain-containing protein [Defluviitaleaceae bacterium]|nr:ATP-binding cassette domain-containing protein [Defluviitaleaceae bacterium]